MNIYFWTHTAFSWCITWLIKVLQKKKCCFCCADKETFHEFMVWKHWPHLNFEVNLTVDWYFPQVNMSPYVTLTTQLCCKNADQSFFFSLVYNSVIETQSSACLLLDKHLEVLKLLMAAAECRTSQLQPHFLDQSCQSECWPERMGGPVSHRESWRRRKGELRE